ncbi:MAG: helix-turn-helix transcriptional regulator [Promethearchaeia archaeon]
MKKERYRPVHGFRCHHPFILRFPFFTHSMNEAFPLGREKFKEMKELFILTIISSFPQGITIYQMHSIFKFSRGMLLKTFEDLTKKGYLKTEESEYKGRKQKYYKITEKGKNYLEILKSKWANKFAFMSEMVSPEEYDKAFLYERFKQFILKRMEMWDNSEEAISFIKELKLTLESLLHRIEIRRQRLEMEKSKIDLLLSKIESLETVDLDILRKIIKKELESNN